MKEISKELRDRNCVICCNCGAIYADAPPHTVLGGATCPECNSDNLYWVTPAHTWAEFVLPRNKIDLQT